MNLYFLVEGQSETVVYPQWLSYLLPYFRQVRHFKDVLQEEYRHRDNYCMFSGFGWPSVRNSFLINTIQDINEVGCYDYLVVCIDSDDKPVVERVAEIRDYLDAHKVRLKNGTQLKIIVQNRCLETWFLGNSAQCPKTVQDTVLKRWLAFYNVCEKDPERMADKPSDFRRSLSQFHFHYLRRMLGARRLVYNKHNLKVVARAEYLKYLIDRSYKKSHLPSFRYFLDFCFSLSSFKEPSAFLPLAQ